jgi:hypothetical protein
MSLNSRKSPILSSLSTRRKHHIHTAPTEQNSNTSDAEKRERPFAPIKVEGDGNPAPKSYKSILSL